MRLRTCILGLGLLLAPACVFDESGQPMPAGTADVDASVPESTVDAAPTSPPDATPPPPPDAAPKGPGPGGGPGHH